MPKGTEKKKKKIERNVGKHEHGNEKKKVELPDPKRPPPDTH